MCFKLHCNISTKRPKQFLCFSKDGSTALMCACEHGYAKVVKRLLAVDGCDASIADHVSYIIS